MLEIGYTETVHIHTGNGCGPKKDHAHLHLDHMDRHIIDDQLPGIRDTVKTFLGIDVYKDPVPVVPTVLRLRFIRFYSKL